MVKGKNRKGNVLRELGTSWGGRGISKKKRKRERKKGKTKKNQYPNRPPNPKYRPTKMGLTIYQVKRDREGGKGGT